MDSTTQTNTGTGKVAVQPPTAFIKPIEKVSEPVYDTFGNEFSPPDYSIKDILDAIPQECYKRSYIKSYSYVARDAFFIGLFAYMAYAYLPLIPSASGRAVAWALYSIVQGLFGTGLWVLAHECGHSAFSDSNAVNNVTGWVLHSSMLVPYYAWKLTHSMHHKSTGHLTRDMVFVPKDRKEFMENRGAHDWSELVEDAPLMTLYGLFTQQVFGWPLYLLSNVTGQKYPKLNRWAVNHFNPNAPLFEKKDWLNIWISNVGIGITMSIIAYSINRWGLASVTLYYLIPYLWVNHWLVAITYLQHTDPTLPHYHADQWNFTRGAAATIDREFGFIGSFCFHDIIETHVLHHYVSRIPFYNARIATEKIKKVMGKHYRHDDTNFIKSLYTVARTCQFVEGKEGIQMFRNMNGVGVAPDGLPSKK